MVGVALGLLNLPISMYGGICTDEKSTEKFYFCLYEDIPSHQSMNSYLEAREWLIGLPTLSVDAVSRLLAPQDSYHTLPLQKSASKKVGRSLRC